MNPSERIDQLIARLTDWRGKTLAGVLGYPQIGTSSWTGQAAM